MSGVAVDGAGLGDGVMGGGGSGRSAAEEAAFVAERRTGIGGSDAHHLAYEEPWGCRRKLWFQKRGVPEDFPESRPDRLAPMERGHALEDMAAELYADRTGRKIRRLGTKRRKGKPHLLVHCDRAIVAGVPTFDGPGVLEVKVPGERAFWKIAREGLQPAYVLQLQWAFMVTGYQWGSFVVLWADGWRMLHFDVRRDDALCTQLERMGDAFWREVENGPKPDGLPVDDARCRRCPYRKTCHGTAVPALAAEERDDQVAVVDDGELAALLADYDDAKTLVDQDTAVLDRIKAEVKARLGDREAVEVAGRRVYHRRAKDSVVLDAEGLRAVEPSLPMLTWLLEPFRKVRRGAVSLRIF